MHYLDANKTAGEKARQQHPTNHQLYGHLPPITKTIQIRWTRHAGHCWRSRDELISDVLLWTPTYGWAKAGRPALTYIHQLCEDMGCSPEDLPEVMNDREKWRKGVRDIRAGSTTWWWCMKKHVAFKISNKNFIFKKTSYFINWSSSRYTYSMDFLDSLSPSILIIPHCW